MEREGRAVRVRFLSASELGIADPPDGVQCGRAIRDFCRNESIPLVLIDGPQGWKSRTSTLKHARVCERLLNTPGKTGPEGITMPRPYAPFIRFSIAVFAELVRQGAAMVLEPTVRLRTNGLLAAESFPYAAWRKLGIRPLPAKGKCKHSDLGDRLRTLKGIFGFEVAGELTHDGLQAVVGGLGGVAILTGDTAGYVAEGVPPRFEDGVIVEGFIVSPLRPAESRTQCPD